MRWSIACACGYGHARRRPRAGGCRVNAAAAVWPRIAGCKPRLHGAVKLSRQRFRGSRWVVLHDPATGRWQRVNETAYRAICLLDGERTLADVRAALANHGPRALSELELVGVIDGLNQAELIDWGTGHEAGTLHARARIAQRHRRWSRLLSPLSLRIPLMDPEAMLERLRPLALALFSPGAVACLVLILLAASVVVVCDWSDISGYWQQRGIAAQAWLLAPLVYLVMKSVHECAHALAVKRWGGEVHRVGISFLLLLPLPYVDASAAWGFADKRQRMLVGAAGILAELGLAAIAALVFSCTEPGVVKDLAYTAMVLGSVSTLIFNGNPLLRYDGYYVLADAVEIPNLAPRAARYWRYLAQRYAFGLREVASPVTAAGERAWFVCYGAASTLYRVLGVCAIAIAVSASVPVLGLLLAVWVLCGQIGWPLARGLHYVLMAPPLAARRRRAVGVTACGVLGLLVALTAVRLPLSAQAEGIVWLPPRGEIRAGAEGSVVAVLFARRVLTKGLLRAATVVAGTPLLQLENPLLTARMTALEWTLAETRARQGAARMRDPTLSAQLADQLTRLAADLAALRKEANALVITSPVSGRLVVPDAYRLPGRYLRQGDVVAYVIEAAPPLVRVALPQADAALLGRREGAIGVRLVDQPQRVVQARIRQQVPSATRELPGVALGALGGGQIAVEPTQPRRAMEAHFIVDLELPAGTSAGRIGGRAIVRFEQAAEPLAERLHRAWRRVLLDRLGV